MKTKCMSCGGSMKKMAVGGTTTKRIIKKSTGGMYGIPQENLGTSGQHGFAKKGGAVKKYKVGGMAAYEKSSYDKKMDAKGSNGKEGSAKDKAADKKAAIKMGYIKKEGGTHKMPNGKVMLNSAMKKGGLVKKKK